MKYFTALFVAPMVSVRPCGGRLIEGFSPKLQRRVRLFSHASFAQWMRLDVDPAVSAFCERPARMTRESGARLIDFWLQGAEGEEMLLVDPDETGVRPAQVDNIPVRVVSAAEFAAASVWVANWACMLPIINATMALLPQALLESVVRHVREPVSLAVLEHKLSSAKPSLARGAIFEQIRIGRMGALSLQTQPINLHTIGADSLSRRWHKQAIDPANWPAFDASARRARLRSRSRPSRLRQLGRSRPARCRRSTSSSSG